jgi:hypothetical protein
MQVRIACLAAKGSAKLPNPPYTSEQLKKKKKTWTDVTVKVKRRFTDSYF